MELEPVVSLVDVLEEDEELENEACAVLGGSDSEKCSYSQVGARWGPCFPRAPAEPSLPGRTCPVPASRSCLSRGGLEPPFGVGFPIPGPAALLPSVLPVSKMDPLRPRPSSGRSGFSRLWPWSSCSCLPLCLFSVPAAFHATIPVTSHSFVPTFPTLEYLLGTEWRRQSRVRGGSPGFENLPGGLGSLTVGSFAV